MRTCMAAVLVLALAGSALAQGFIPKADQDARKRELAGYATRLMDTKDSRDRGQVLKELLEKDAIKDASGRVLGDGFAVEALLGLFKQGIQNDDADARLYAVMGLAQLKGATAQNAIVEILNTDPSDAVQLRALGAIEKENLQTAGKDALAKLRSANPEVVGAAARCLASLGYDPQNQSSSTMIELMVQSYRGLLATPADAPDRDDLQRLIEILGQSVAKLVPALNWAPGQSMSDLGKEIDKFTGWWNARFTEGLKSATFQARRDALSRISRTADRASFQTLLDAVRVEADRLAAPADFPERPLSAQFVVDGAALLNRISGLSVSVRNTSTPEELKAAVAKWQEWTTKNPQ